MDRANPLTSFTLTNCTLIDGKADRPTTGASIAVASGRIAESAAVRAGEVIDLNGCTILPGFINAHCHPGFKQQNGQDLLEYDRDYLRACLNAGVTTIRDMGALDSAPIEAVLADRDLINNDLELPRIVSPGKFVAAPGGYGGRAPLIATDPESAAAAVHHAAQAGADFIKTSLEHGISPDTRGLPLLSAELLRVICATAHGIGLRVSAHLTQSDPLRLLVAAGIDEAAHVPYEPMDDALIECMVSAGVVMTPTLTVHRMIADKWGAPILAAALDNTQRFHRAGGLIAVGDDFVTEEAPWFLPGLPFVELELLQRAGLSAMDVLKALTAGGARVCGIDADVGTVEAGKWADLTIVRGDPSADLIHLRDVVMVIIKGRIVVDRRAE